MKQIVIVAGSSPKQWPDVSAYVPAETFWIGVDRGGFYLIEQGIQPNIAVGDFDSLSVEELARVKGQAKEVYQAPAEKDQTDTQLALSLAIEKVSNCPIILIGGTGGRLDHLLSNLWPMLDERFVSVINRFNIQDEQNSIQFYLPGSYELTKEPDKKYLAFVCLTPVSELTLTAVKYPLLNEKIPYPISLASNEFQGEQASFSFSSGQVAVIQSRDK